MKSQISNLATVVSAHTSQIAIRKSQVANRKSQIPLLLLWTIIGLSCALPILWMLAQIALNPTTLRELHLDSFRLHLLGRTLLYNGAAAVIATALAIPAALVLGRGRGWFAAALWFVLPVALLLPSIAFAYGWSQFLRLIGDLRDPPWYPEPTGFIDTLRCIWSLATWLWPLPAMVMGLALRRSDTQVQQQALLDGALGRVLSRLLLGPAIASAAMVAILAMQEFAVYEPTGISVVATEVRMVFETGAYSSEVNPITQPILGTGIAWSLPDQAARAAAAVATSLPLLVIVALLVVVAAMSAGKLSISEHVEPGSWPRALDARRWAACVSWLIVAVALLVPLVSLILSLKRPFIPTRVWAEFGPQASGSLVVAGATGLVAATVALLAAAARARGAVVVALISFLIGGQLIAIAMIRIYNRAWLDWVYHGWPDPLAVMTYVARFGWIALLAGAATWTGAWRSLRDMSAVDGATPLATAACVVWPLAWPMLLAGSAFVMILSLSEVPATVLLNPQRPQMLVPMMMTWVHMLRYDAMIEATLLIAGMVAVLGLAAVALVRLGLAFAPAQKSQNSRNKQQTNLKSQIAKIANRKSQIANSLLLCCFLPLGFSGCADGAKPDAIWCDTGTGPAQTVYPRAITYNPAGDSFFIVDRQARIQQLDRRGRFINEWQTPQWLQGKPVGLSVGPDGNLWVPDTHYYRVLVYSLDGTLLKQFGSRGTGPGEFIYPTDIAFGPDGRVFVSEYGDHDRIQVFDMDGNYLYEFGRFGQGDGELSRPQSLAMLEGLLYVADACNHRIAVFTLDGDFVKNIGRVGSGLGEFRFPYGLDVDADGSLIVCEFGNNRVQKIDPRTGQGLAIWGGPGRAPGQLAYPWGVAVDKRNRIVTVDAGNNRLQVFQF